eukprot:TRINITY_DN30112_c0_g1_i1.p1 TRINITY_DN30112_c0_g1~~TRINITY_DN30112_c0_g1_i1.p1  ORF type:complete len:554 (+),score=130.99 TRINITY_DN30112_c0_g1_i1:59-1720(+)
MDELISRLEAVLENHEKQLMQLLERASLQQDRFDNLIIRGQAGNAPRKAAPKLALGRSNSCDISQPMRSSSIGSTDVPTCSPSAFSSTRVNVGEQGHPERFQKARLGGALDGLTDMKNKYRAQQIAISSSVQNLQEMHWSTRFIHTLLFKRTCAFLITTNSIFLGIQISYAPVQSEASPVFFAMQLFFTVCFTVEVLLRMLGERLLFVFGDDCAWNFFDLIVVTCTLIEAFTEIVYGESSANLGGARIMRVLKTFRVVRIFRVSRYFRELRIMAASIVLSLRSLLWALILYGIVTYIFAITLAQASLEYLASDATLGADEARVADLDRFFGTLARSSNTLVQITFNGASWGPHFESLALLSWFYRGVFLSYVLFMSLAMLNVITGVFVGTAIQGAYEDVDTIIQDEIKDQDSASNKLKQIFREADANGSGALELDAFQSYIKDHRVKAYLSSLGLTINEARNFFKLLDAEGNGLVNSEDFIIGCLKLKGPASCLDVHSLMHENKRMLRGVASMVQRLEEEIEDTNLAVREASHLNAQTPLEKAPTLAPSYIAV